MYQIVKVFYDSIGKHRDTLCRNVQTIETSLLFLFFQKLLEFSVRGDLLQTMKVTFLGANVSSRIYFIFVLSDNTLN